MKINRGNANFMVEKVTGMIPARIVGVREMLQISRNTKVKNSILMLHLFVLHVKVMDLLKKSAFCVAAAE